jgi:hypothetical protein
LFLHQLPPNLQSSHNLQFLSLLPHLPLVLWPSDWIYHFLRSPEQWTGLVQVESLQHLATKTRTDEGMNHTQIIILGAQRSAWHPQEERRKRNQKVAASAEEAKLNA